MNISSPSFPNGLEGLRSEGEVRGYAHLGMSDDQVANERDAQWRLKDAVETMRKAVRTVNAMSSVIKINMTAWDDFIHDELPSKEAWDEKISEARS